jgi:hypothetical protein
MNARLKFLLPALTAAVLAAALPPAPAIAGSAQSCGSVPFARQSDNGAFQIQARDASCQQARGVASASRPSRFRSGHPAYSAIGFDCTGQDEQLGGQGKHVVDFRCVHGHSAISFLRG